MGGVFTRPEDKTVVTDRKAVIRGQILGRRNYLALRPRIEKGVILVDEDTKTSENAETGGAGPAVDPAPDRTSSPTGAGAAAGARTNKTSPGTNGTSSSPAGPSPVSPSKKNSSSTQHVLNKKPVHLPFLAPEVLPTVIEFLLGGSLLRCLEVSPLWYISFLDELGAMCAPIDHAFRLAMASAGLTLEYARLDWCPVHVARTGFRIDRVLMARVGRRHVGSSIRVGYQFAYGGRVLALMEWG